MSNYTPTPPPIDSKALPEYTHRELRRVGDNLRDDADSVHYLTIATTESLSAAISANWRCSNSNVLRLSTSNTITLTGLAFTDPFRVRTLINVGSGVAVIKSEGTESSASYRFLLSAAAWQLSANAAATVWYDPVSARHRGIHRTA